MKSARAIAALAVLLLSRTIETWSACGQEPPVPRFATDVAAYRKAYQQGRIEAERELHDGKATLYTLGLPAQLFELLDRETGLPYLRMGCVVADTTEGRAQGHNDRIQEHIKARGLPSNSFKRWDKEIYGLARYFEARSKVTKPVTLVPGGPHAKTGDGRFSLRGVSWPIRNDDGEMRERLAIVASEGRVVHPASTLLFADRQADLLWGPEGSGFAVIRCRKGHDVVFEAFDLRRGRPLRWECDRLEQDERPLPKAAGRETKDGR